MSIGPINGPGSGGLSGDPRFFRKPHYKKPGKQREGEVEKPAEQAEIPEDPAVIAEREKRRKELRRALGEPGAHIDELA